MTPEIARECAEAMNEDMGRCILSLYRSARQPKMAEWGAELARAERRPSLVVVATEDHYTGGEALARRSAERWGSSVAVLAGLGHWWMVQDPARAAKALATFLGTLD
jgi:pimeloyl-ACP methyl ester carboxylesterase